MRATRHSPSCCTATHVASGLEARRRSTSAIASSRVTKPAYSCLGPARRRR
jgi:hypothetical protein